MPRLLAAACVLLLSACQHTEPEDPSHGIPAAHARNVILFVGRGMDPTIIAAARIEKGQSNRTLGEDNRLSFEDFPTSALTNTRDTDLQTDNSAERRSAILTGTVPTDNSAGTTDKSAAAMSAIMTGTTTRGASMGMDAIPKRGQCSEARGHELPTLLEQAKAAGLAVGLVSTSRVTHPMPAATYAHVTDAEWEVDATMSELAKAQGCHDIAYQLVDFHHGSGLDVVFGGGRMAFMTGDQPDPVDAWKRGVRRNDRLIETWQKGRPDGRLVYTRDDMEKAIGDVSLRGPILGLFAPDHMNFESNRISDAIGQPSLTEMTRAAIATLSREQRGYVLVIVAGGIERARLDQDKSNLAVAETVELSNAVRAAMQTTRAEDTLIVVTSAGGDLPIYARGPGSQLLHRAIELTGLHAIMTAALGLR